MSDQVVSKAKGKHAARSEAGSDAPTDNVTENRSIPHSSRVPTVPSGANIPIRTWDSLGEVGESDLPSLPIDTSSSTPEGDFGFTGTFVSDDIVLGGSLEVRQNKVTLWASGAQLASWSASNCRVVRLSGNEFSIEADDEMIAFTPDDPDGLSAAISAFVTPWSASTDAPQPTPILKRSPTHSVRRQPAKPGGSEHGAKATLPAFEPELVEQPENPSIEQPATGPAPEPKSTVYRRARIKNFETSSLPAADTAQTRRVESDPDAVVTDPDYDETASAAEEDGGTIADSITANAKRRYRAAKAHRWQLADLESVAIKSGVIVAAIGIVTLFALTIYILTGGFQGTPEFAPSPPTTTIPPSPTTTVVVTTTLPAPTMLFQTGTAELTERWNDLAEQSRPELALFNELTSPFLLSLAPHITLEGLLDPTTGSIVLRATPTGTPEGDGQILTALGLLIGTADPSLSGSDRRALLEILGLRIQDPQLSGLDGMATHNGLAFQLVFLADQGVLEFRITPEGAVVTTTTSSTTTVP